jgi:lipid A ethanolaminephosphotransferase
MLIKSRPTLSPVTLAFLVAIWISIVSNWASVYQFVRLPELEGSIKLALFVLGGWLYQLIWTLGLIAVVGIWMRHSGLRYWCALLLVLAANVGYFTNFLGIQFDRSMLANVIQTHPAEAMELISTRYIMWLVLVGVLPALLVLRVKLEAKRGLWAIPKDALILFALPLAMTVLTIYPQYQAYASARRNHIVHFNPPSPANVLVAAVGYVNARRKASIVRTQLGLDAHPRHTEIKPRLYVFVLGETARAQNQQLGGYPRPTNPRMASIDNVASFPYTESCGTATAQSVPCIFSGLTRQDFSVEKAGNQDNLLDVIQRSGFDVMWFDNDSGCKGVCDRVPNQDLTYANHPTFCAEKGDCHDGILIEALKAHLPKVKKDTMIVLHLKGSHGPAYYKRYPPEFEKFTPACQSNELTRCSSESLINAYDNTILYTDHILGEVVSLLKGQESLFAPLMIYVSDHGESLGENGLYLHGLPYAIAPEVQTRVPMLYWFSQSFLKMEGWAADCPAKLGSPGRSHDNIYSTVLGLLEIDTQVYRKELDLFEACEQGELALKK